MSSMNGGWGCLEKLELVGPGFRTEEMLIRDFVRGVLDPEGITGLSPGF